MRLPLLPPADLSPDQKNLYDDMADVIEKNLVNSSRAAATVR